MEAVTAHNINYDLIPQECSNLPAALKSAGFPIDSLLNEIISDENLSDGFDYVISHLETAQQREKYYSKLDPAKGERDKRQLLARLKRELQDGTFNKFFTASKEMQNILDQISDIEDGFPFETTIVMDYYDGKTLPKFT